MSRPTVILLLAGLAAGCAAPGERTVFRKARPGGPIAEQIRPAIRVVNPDGQVAPGAALVLELKLVNASGEDAVVYNELQPGWLVMIEVLGDDGRFVRSDWLTKQEQRQRGRCHHARLPPGGFVGRFYRISPSDPRWDLSPGRYRVRVTYRNPFQMCALRPGLSDREIEELGKNAVVPLLTGALVSNVVSFQVQAD
ncbi:MAG: hypothetical protein R6V58_12185 [Planctomycetota bacterium]